MRTLLQAGAGAAAAAAHLAAAPDGPQAAAGLGLSSADPAQQSLTLRVAALFVILAAGLLGGVPPLLLRGCQVPDAAPGRLARAFGGGVILALALVHVLPEGLEMLAPLTPFPLGAVLAALGLLSVLAIDHAATARYAPEPWKRQLRAAVLLASGADEAPPGAPEAARARASGGAGKGLEAPLSPTEAHAADGCRSCAGEVAAAAGVPSHPAQLIHSHHHSPGHPVTGLRQLVAAYTLEAGCVFHSVILGLGIGIMADDPAGLPPLIAAMAFHQALEAVALGSVLAAALLVPRWKKAAMIVIYSLTMPLGIAAGIGVASTFDPASPAAAAVQGALSCFSAGLLLHIAMYTMIGEEASRHDLLVRPALAAGVFGAVAAGVGCMALLAVWG
ncbi:zinc-nutrition responsive transporter [Raphidocelis subcapitata]|uniref:Zinc-nutrition responsive transporter n=1 Tax=Raphidocelis subcapitata TaxID=307507 RepID=A0A2V0PFZ4_9CHLO|nr:zinc-nutrition responsive transporter [Raphidocelis subcapitata]|eukprot:GBF95975.1 zinc-nutrition responsive transporter [Raphidocelis subcapitata]